MTFRSSLGINSSGVTKIFIFKNLQHFFQISQNHQDTLLINVLSVIYVESPNNTLVKFI